MNRSTLYRLAVDRVSPLHEQAPKQWTFQRIALDGSKSPGPVGNYYEVSYQRKLEIINHARQIQGASPIKQFPIGSDWRTQIP